MFYKEGLCLQGVLVILSRIRAAALVNYSQGDERDAICSLTHTVTHTDSFSKTHCVSLSVCVTDFKAMPLLWKRQRAKSPHGGDQCYVSHHLIR